jgi:hypothetical protein
MQPGFGSWGVGDKQVAPPTVTKLILKINRILDTGNKNDIC